MTAMFWLCLKTIFKEWVWGCEGNNIMINVKKTKFMVAGKVSTELISTMLGNEALEQADKLKFLGLYITSSDDCTKHIKI